MSCSSNPRRTPVTNRDPNANGLNLKTTSLPKGATFHSPSTSYVIPSLRRSQTTLDDVVDAYRRRAASTLLAIDESLNGLAAKTDASLKDSSLPVPRGILDIALGDAMASTSVKTEDGRRILRTRTVRQPSDSGVGSSIVTAPAQKRAIPVPKVTTGTKSCGSATAGSASTTTKLAGLSRKGHSQINNHILKPLLANPYLKELHFIVQDVRNKILVKDIVCLRDVEKTLLSSRENTTSSGLYLEFSLASVALIHSTVDQLSERDQTRATDCPYNNGYFLDLCEQVRHFASQLSDKEKPRGTGSASLTDEIKMYGGIAVNGRAAELIRVGADGKAFSLRDGREIEDDTNDLKDGAPQLKRSLSRTRHDAEEIRRSMARRKKNPSPEELAPKRCKHPGCNKQFGRRCDLTKHEKTHSRPWKCPEPTCKYHELGWPTEKEMDRHYNDKHASNPYFFVCRFEKCAYKSKRESNCKQHMEKTHNWVYERSKNNGKQGRASVSSGQPSPILPALPTEHQIAQPTPFSSIRGHSTVGPTDPILIPSYPSENDFLTQWGEQPADLALDMDLDLSPVADNNTPSSDPNSEPMFNFQPDVTVGDDIYSATMQLPPTPSLELFMKGLPTDNCSLLPTGPIPINTSHQNVHQPQSLGQAQPHMSPIGHGNTMLFTPSSMKEEAKYGFTDEGLGESTGEDFTLFPPAKVAPSGFGPMLANSLFGEMPRGAGGFTHPSSQYFSLNLANNLTPANLQVLDQMTDQMASAASMHWPAECGFSR